MKKENKLKYVLITLVSVSLVLNFMYLGKSFYQNMQKRIYSSAYNNTVSTMFTKAKSTGYIELVLDGEKLKLIVDDNEEI
jgi:hypothetical protein